MTESRGTQQQLVSHANGSASGRGLSNSQNLNTFPDTDIEEFKDKTMHKPDHVQRELVELRRKLNNRVRELF